MARTQYETAEQRKAENAVANSLAGVWKVHIEHLSPAYRFDWAIFRGPSPHDACRGFMEIKIRKKKYDTLILSLHKAMAGIEYATVSEALLVVKWPDGIYRYIFDGNELQEFDICWGGRKDRDDSADMEPVLHIPVNKFTRVLMLTPTKPPLSRR